MRIFLFCVACGGVLACWHFLPFVLTMIPAATQPPLHRCIAVSVAMINIQTRNNAEHKTTELSGVKLRVGSVEAEPSGPMEPSLEQVVGSLWYHVEYAEPVPASGIYFELAEHLSSDASYKAAANLVMHVEANREIREGFANFSSTDFENLLY